MKKIDFKVHPVVRAYTLSVCHRFKNIDEGIFGIKDYYKRRTKDIQESENFRKELHQEAIKVLKNDNLTENQAIKILEMECDRLIKEKLKTLKKGERFCGCCRTIIKIEDWKEHQIKEKILHDYLAKELMQLSREAMMLKIQKMKETK